MNTPVVLRHGTEIMYGVLLGSAGAGNGIAGRIVVRSNKREAESLLTSSNFRGRGHQYSLNDLKEIGWDVSTLTRIE